jgi:hypothetical protein
MQHSVSVLIFSVGIGTSGQCPLDDLRGWLFGEREEGEEEKW